MSQAECDDQLSRVDPRPLGDCGVTAISAEGGDTDQGKDGRQGMAFAASVARIGDLAQHFDQRRALCYRLRNEATPLLVSVSAAT